MKKCAEDFSAGKRRGVLEILYEAVNSESDGLCPKTGNGHVG
jgi:hypothetical protein